MLGILLGLVWGLLPLKGFLGLVLFGAVSAGLVYVWITAVQVRHLATWSPETWPLDHLTPGLLAT